MATTTFPTTTVYTNRKFPLGKIFLIIILLIAIQLTFHALLTHMEESEAVDQACGQNPIGLWKNTDKFFQICGMPDGSYGIRVLVQNLDGTFRKVTGFVRKTHGKPVMDFSKVKEYIEITCKAVEQVVR